MTKRPSTPSIKITYVNGVGEPQEIRVRALCRMDGDALVLTKFETANGEKVTDLPIAVPRLGGARCRCVRRGSAASDRPRRLGDVPLPPAEIEPKHEAPRPAPSRERRRASGPLRQYDEAANPAPAAGTVRTPPTPEPAPRGPAVMPPVTKATGATTGPPAGSTVRALDDGEAASLRTLIEAKAGQTRWANGAPHAGSGTLPERSEAAERAPRKPPGVSLDPSRAESRTPLATALRGILEEVRHTKQVC